MANTELPLPSHFEPDRIPEFWRVPYGKRASEARAWAREHDIAPAAGDDPRTLLLAVDMQNTFCTPGFELFVAGPTGDGAVRDSERLCAFVYRNLHRISAIAPTLDTHRALQIFHPDFLAGPDGEPPEPYTQVTADDVTSGRWRARPSAAADLGMEPDRLQAHLVHYVRSLEDIGKYDLTVWPYHAMLGGIGHAMVSTVEETFFFHSIARRTSPRFALKGNNPLTEHYSAVGPEVRTGADGEEIGTVDEEFLNRLKSYDAVIVAGQAKSHCVAWTVSDILSAAPQLTDRLYLLEDCTSPVVVPGADFTDAADAVFARFAADGAHIVRSTDPIDTWPGTLGND